MMTYMRDEEYMELRRKVCKDRDTMLVVAAGDHAIMRKQQYDDTRQKLIDMYIIKAAQNLQELAELRMKVYLLEKELAALKSIKE